MNSLRPLLPLTVLALGSALAQSAATPVVLLDPFPVLAHPSGADERAASVRIVTADAATLPACDLAGLLRDVPGLVVDQPGGPGGRSTLYLRGGEENHTAVFLDGIPLNDPTNNRGGAVDLATLEPALLRSAAVVSGAASVRYGPDILAGALHLGGQSAPTNEAAMLVDAGGTDFRRAALGASRVLGDGASSLHVGVAGADDGSLAAGSRAERRVARGAFATRLGSTNLQVSLWHLRHEADSFPDESGGIEYAVLRDLEHRENRQTAGSVRLDGEAGAGRWTASADAAQFEATVGSPGVLAPADNPYDAVPPSTDDTHLRRYRASLGYEHNLSGWATAVGVDAQREQGTSNGSIDYGAMILPTAYATDRDRLGAYAETSGKLLPSVTLVGGARVDHYDTGATRGTYRAGLFGLIGSATQWRVNAGTSFKPASFYALANPLVGDPELKPERARSLDAGLRQAFAEGRLLVDLTGFASRIRDGVDYDPVLGRLVNRSGIHSRGAELTTTWRPCDTLAVGGTLTYTNGHSTPGRERLRCRPEWRGGVSATWTPVPTFVLEARLTASSDLPDSAKPTGARLVGGWARADLSARWSVSKHCTLTAALDNALDQRYAEAIGFTAPGRRVRVGLLSQF